MIAEPYICLPPYPRAGAIEWYDPKCFCLDDLECWQPYADFEREKLSQLFDDDKYSYEFTPDIENGYTLMGYTSDHLIGYGNDEHFHDSESSRLLKRAEFLKAVCEKEGVEWLPKECTCNPKVTFGGKSFCPGHFFDGEPLVERPEKKSIDVVEKLTKEQKKCICRPDICQGRYHCICPCHYDRDDSIYYPKIKICRAFDTEGKELCSPRCEVCKGREMPRPSRDYYTKEEMKDILGFFDLALYQIRLVLAQKTDRPGREDMTAKLNRKLDETALDIGRKLDA